MVINGAQIEDVDFSYVKLEGQRIRLPSHLVRSAAHARFAGSEAIKCWLLVLAPGRYRLIMQTAAAETGDLSTVMRQIEAVGAAGDALDATENHHAAIRARLIPCTVSPGPGWRLTLPKEARQLVPEREERSFVFVLTVAGFIELWFPDTLRHALSVPLSEALS